MNLAQADKILSPYLKEGPWTSETIKGAFREAVKSLHPDSSRGMAEAIGGTRVDSIAEIKEARDVLLAHYGEAFDKPKCPICRGTGKVGTWNKRHACPKGCAPA